MQKQTRVLTLHQSELSSLLSPPGLQSAGSPSPPRMQMLHNEQLPSQKYVHKMDILCFEQEDSSVSGVLPGPWYTCGFLNYDKIWPNWLNWCVSIFPSCNTRVHNMWTQLLPIILILIVLGLANMVTFLFVDFLQHFVLTISFFLFGLVSVCQLVD